MSYKVSFSLDFMRQIQEMPKKVQKGLWDFIVKLQNNPYDHNVNLEKIHDFKDQKLRTARVTLDYRAIVAVLDNKSFFLLYVDHHDEAMNWACNKKLAYNAYTEGFQIIPMDVVNLTSSTDAIGNERTSFFSQYSDVQLKQIGVPDESLGIVRSIYDLSDLERQEDNLPSDVFEHLFNMMDGVSYENILDEIIEGKEKDINGNSANNRRFFVEVADDKELSMMLNKDFELWHLFLHPSQRKLVEEDYKGSMKVTGGAGTGKTVAAMHRLKRLSEKAEKESVLYTTFTKALMKNLEHQINALDINIEACVLQNIVSLAYDIATKYVIDIPDIALEDYNKKSLTIWKSVVEENPGIVFDAHFLKKEYDDVIVYNNNITLYDYLKQSRVGRQIRLTTPQRKLVWKCAELFKKKCQEEKLMSRYELYNLLTNYLTDNQLYPFKHIIVDEIQDFSNPELRFIRAMVPDSPNDLFLVGDPYQCIYNDRAVSFKRVGINILGKRSRILRLNYRTTEEIKRAAVNIIKGESYDDFEEGQADLKGYVSLLHGKKPEYQIYGTFGEEMNSVLETIQDCQSQHIAYNEIAIAAFFKDSIKSIQTVLHENGIPYNNYDGKTKDPSGVWLSTLHSLKGLEFKVVIICDVCKRTYPYLPKDWENMTTTNQSLYLRNLKSLMYMAFTRAREYVSIVGYGEKAKI